jgi:predicted permease
LVRKVLVCAQVVVAAVLLIPTGLLMKSMVNLFHVDLGVRTENVVGFALSPELNGYKPAQSKALFERVESEMAALPGVRNVSDALVPLIGDSRWGSDVHPEGYTPAPGQNSGHAWYNEIGPGYFGKMGIPLIAGREFSEADNLGGPQVALINEEFVRKYFAGKNPVGRHFGTGVGQTIEIVGVVKDSHYAAVKEKPYPVFYIPWRQDKEIGSMVFYVRTALPPENMIAQVRQFVARIDRNLPADGLRTLDQQIALNISNERILVQLASAFAMLATALAMLGLYGVMAHSVARRTREIGIRMAIGATPRLIRGMVMRDMLWIVGIGLVLGVPAALLLAKYTESQLYGVKPQDTVVTVCAALVLAATAAVAAFVPARRASKVSPMRALRYE